MTDQPALLFLRKSRDTAETDQVLQRHRQALLEVAQRQSLRVVAELSEIISGDKAHALIDEAVRLCDGGAVRAILAMDPDRMTRDPGEGDRLLKALQRGRVLLVTPDQIYDARDDTHELVLSLKWLFARQELKAYRRRVASSAAQIIRREGRSPTGAAPFGYRYVNTVVEEGGRPRVVFSCYETDPVEYPIVVFAWSLVRDYGTHEILQRIRERFGERPGPRTRPGPKEPASQDWLTRSGLAQMFANPFYGGRPGIRRRIAPGQEAGRKRTERLPQEEWVLAETEGDYPHPVSWVEWLELREVIQARAHARPRTGINDTWARAVLRCPAGATMNGSGRTYVCACPQGHRVLRARVNAALTLILHHLTALPGFLPALEAEATQRQLSHQQHRQQRQAQERELVGRLQGIEAQHRLLLQRLTDLPGNAPAWMHENYAGREQALLQEHAALTAQLAQLREAAGRLVPGAEELALVREVVGDFPAQWQLLTGEQRRRLCALCVRRVTLQPVGERRYTLGGIAVPAGLPPVPDLPTLDPQFVATVVAVRDQLDRRGWVSIRDLPDALDGRGRVRSAVWGYFGAACGWLGLVGERRGRATVYVLPEVPHG